MAKTMRKNAKGAQNEPILTITMGLYNKANYLRDALDSVFAQVTTYPFIVLISDNASTDGSLEIAKEYAVKHPNQIKILESDANKGIVANFLKLYENTKTKYFANLDPDDYWLGTSKIQDALDFLEKNPDFASYQGKALIKSPQKEWIFVDYPQDHTCTFEGLCAGYAATMGHSSNSFFRNDVFKNGVPEEIKNPARKAILQASCGDSFRNFIHLRAGKAYYSTKIDSVYRYNQDGDFSSLGEFNNIIQRVDNCFFWRELWDFFGREHIVFLLVSAQIFQAEWPNILEYLNALKDEQLREKIISLLELKGLYEANTPALLSFQQMLAQRQQQAMQAAQAQQMQAQARDLRIV